MREIVNACEIGISTGWWEKNGGLTVVQYDGQDVC